MVNRIRSVRRWSLVVLSAVAAVPVVLACGGSKPADTAQNPPPPTAGGSNCPPGYPNCPPAGTTATMGTMGPTGPTAPASTASTMPSQGPMGPVVTPQDQLGQLLSGIASAAAGVMTAGGAVGDPTEAGLKAQSLRYAPNMTAEGQEMKQQFTEGQHFEMMVPMQAGKCYTIIGFGSPGAIKDLDLNLLTPLSLPPYSQLAGQDTTHDNHPTIGGSPNFMCPVIALPLQYKLDVYARSGSGTVAVQVYSKNK